ncbi:hydroxyacid dehydrogenase [Aliidiomarina minuta]|uniref:Hydroxyacid dehydrogenase n=1 Tax=Aliidiomarina minuta TaxID=880057 RepID=A0A432W834_9GAMM|nr:2-hydroxyacid dehydrogenase [Aliidiomarina minuta]RUO26273.1 hydroxyacid dehydrogenase [Aliidiomarina minuta]
MQVGLKRARSVPNILLSNFYSDTVLRVVDDLLPKGFNLLKLEEPGKAGILKKAAQADYLLVGGRTRIDEDILNAATRLKMIQRSGVGLDSIDLDGLRERDIPLYVNAGVNARSVAEHSVMLMLGILRNVHLADHKTRSGQWVKHDLGMQCHDLYQKTVGLIGMGSIGQYVAKMLQGFDVNVIYSKRTQLPTKKEKELNVSFCAFDELLRRSDIVSLHCPLTPDTRELIGEEAIGLMKKGAYLVNTARGGMVNETALIQALETNHLGGAALDVFCMEPLESDSPLLATNKLLLTPHMGGITIETFSSMISAAFDNIVMFEREMFTCIDEKKVV